MTDETNEQDTGIQKPAVPDQNWARTQPMFIAPSQQRLDRPHQVVSIKNTSDLTVTVMGKPVPQKHIVIDRYNAGHELEPGETKHNIDMLADDIEYFIRERSQGRINHMNRPKPRHPIQIIGFDETKMKEEVQPVKNETQTAKHKGA
jgi:hypothetical protein